MVGGKGLDVHFNEADEWTSVVGPGAAAAIDDDPDPHDDASLRFDDVDCLLHAAAAGHNVFGDDESLARRNRKATPQNQTAGFFFNEDVPFPERPADLLADNDPS